MMMMIMMMVVVVVVMMMMIIIIVRPKQFNKNYDCKAKLITCKRVPVKHP